MDIVDLPQARIFPTILTLRATFSLTPIFRSLRMPPGYCSGKGGNQRSGVLVEEKIFLDVTEIVIVITCTVQSRQKVCFTSLAPTSLSY